MCLQTRTRPGASRLCGSYVHGCILLNSLGIVAYIASSRLAARETDAAAASATIDGRHRSREVRPGPQQSMARRSPDCLVMDFVGVGTCAPAHSTQGSSSNTSSLAECLETCRASRRCAHAVHTLDTSCSTYSKCTLFTHRDVTKLHFSKRAKPWPCPAGPPPPAPLLHGHGIGKTFVPPGPLTAGSLPRRLAIAYHGAYFRDTGLANPTFGGHPRCSDFFAVASNHHATIFDSLKKANVTFAVFFHTFRSGSDARDRALLSELQPLSHMFTHPQSTVRCFFPSFSLFLSYPTLTLPFPFLRRCVRAATRRQVDSLRLVLYLIDISGYASDAVLLHRFDALYLKPLMALPVRWHLINFAWRCEEPFWSRHGCVSDLFHVVPARFLVEFRVALRISARNQFLMFNNKLGNGHWVFPPLEASLTGEAKPQVAKSSHAHFIYPRKSTSCVEVLCPGEKPAYAGQSGNHSSCRGLGCSTIGLMEPAPFVQLLRHCPGNVSVPRPINYKCRGEWPPVLGKGLGAIDRWRRQVQESGRPHSATRKGSS